MALRPNETGRRGVVSVLAMMYLVLFAVLAIGFHAATTTSARVTYNEVKASRALLAAESGLEFMRYELQQVALPPGTSEATLLEAAYDDLYAQVKGTSNVGANGIGIAHDVISVPGNRAYVDLGDGSRFQATVSRNGARLSVKVIGAHLDAVASGGAGAGAAGARAVKMDFDVAEYVSPVLDYAVATRGTLSMNSNAAIQGAGGDDSLADVLLGGTSNPVLTMDSNAAIAGDVSLASPAGGVAGLGSAKIGGSSAASALSGGRAQRGVTLPEFPTIDTSVFKPYATNVLSAAGGKYTTGTLRNVLIKSGTNPIFDGDVVVEGVIYVETPNVVQFLSNTVVRGVIAVQNNPTGNYANNQLVFDSNAKLYGIPTLDRAVFGSLCDLGGASILAPKFHVRVNSNFGAQCESIFAGKITIDSNAAGTIAGNVVGLDNTSLMMNGNANLTFAEPTVIKPAGVYFSERLTPRPATYEESIP